MSHILTQRSLEDESRDTDNIKGIQDEVDTARVDPEDIKPLVEQDLTEGKQGLNPNLLNSLACLNGLASDLAICRDVKKQQEILLPKEELHEKELAEKMRVLAAKIGGVPVYSPTPQQRSKVYLGRGVSVVLLVSGYATSVNFLHEQMGWTWLGATTLPFVGVLGVGFILKAAFDLLGKKSRTVWTYVFWFSVLVASALAAKFFYLLAGEYETSQKLPTIGSSNESESAAGEHGSMQRFYYSMILEILCAGLAWAFSDEIMREATNMDGEVDNPELKKYQDLIAASRKQQKYHSSRIALANGLISTIQTGVQRLQNDGARLYGKLYAEMSKSRE